jgi:hypothetical protein
MDEKDKKKMNPTKLVTVPSELITRATAELAEDILNDLNMPDPEKIVAMTILNSDEDKDE